RIVLVGTSAPGLTDLRATPLSAAFPGVEIHAGLLSGALDQAQRHPIKVRSPLADTGMLALLLVLGGVLAAAMPMLGAPGVLGLGAVSASGVWIAGAVAWSHHGVLLPVAATLLAVAALTLLNLSLGYLIEGRARRAVAGLFGEYVSPALVERMMRDPQRYSRASSENRELTILFVDIRGFTRIAETMDPEALREYINVFLTVMTEIVHRHGGTLDKYIGDAVMAFWGAPLEDARHADHAVAAAIAMLEAVERLNTMLAGRGMPPLRIGVGVNTGVVRVGDLGSRLRRAYTVIGDPVNLAARFEGLTRQYDAPIIVGETTMRQAGGQRFRALGSARVAGREEPVLIYAPESVAAGSPSCGNHSVQDDPATDPGASTGQALVDEGSGLRL
ncbi:MAG TPA: adenylate/guanylate cyclase domain-containing protein, partial [Quisquiliibacterium sp.]|nr:adenylate/guanylate cyclase domain-containing protein [Quisquiliibacterium sp.]